MTRPDTNSIRMSWLLVLAITAGCSDAPMGNPDLMTPVMAPKVIPLSAGHDRLLGVAAGPQGSFYAAGSIADGTDSTTDFKMLLAKFTAAGELDKSFGNGGYAIKNVVLGAGGELARGIVVQSTGKIVISGTVEHVGATDPRDRDVALVRFNADGTLDSSFGTQGVVILDLSAGEPVGTNYVADNAWGLTVYPDDRLLVSAAQKRTGASDTDFVIVRLTANGMRDTTFGTQGVSALDVNNRSASPRTTTLLANGNIVCSGYMTDGAVVKPVIYRLDSGGQQDMSFGTAGLFTQNVLTAVTEVYGMVLQGTSLVTVGYGRADATEMLDWVSLRISGEGALDTTYGMNGYVRHDVAGWNDNGRALVMLPDNRVLLVGGGRPTEVNSDGMIAVLTENGQKDTTFSATGHKLYDFGGSSDFFWGAAVSQDKSSVALVGTKGVGMDPGNDDAVVMIMPLAN